MTILWNEKTFQTWNDRLERRYNLIEETCLEATNRLRRGDVSAFAAFAKNVHWWESRFQKQTPQLAGVKKKEYAAWERAYRALPEEVREQAEATLPF